MNAPRSSPRLVSDNAALNQAFGHADRPVMLGCDGLWKVYGNHPEERLRRLLDRGEEKATIAASLRSEGSVVGVGGVSFEIKAGEIFVLMGLSGSGKSTLLRCLSRLVDPSAGQVKLDGQDLLSATGRQLRDIRREKMGMVFQHFGLMPHLNVLENVRLPLKLKGFGGEAAKARALEMIELVGLKGREASFPRQMSGGQQQRVGIARSLAGDPLIWLLDEPFSALDPLIRKQMQDEFLDLQRRLHKTIVFVTHDFLEAIRLADRIAIMRDGVIVQMGTPAQLLLEPADDYVARFSADVPLTKALRAGDVAKPVRAPGAPIVPSAASLEEILPVFAAGAKSVEVVLPDGRPAGSISLDAALSTIGPRK